jgi:bacterioferritin-associated ferredoxin
MRGDITDSVSSVPTTALRTPAAELEPTNLKKRAVSSQSTADVLAINSQLHYLESAAKAITNAMYVCNCNALTEKQIRDAIAKRPRDAAAVYRYYDCQPQCGRCVCEVREMLKAAREAKAAA